MHRCCLYIHASVRRHLIRNPRTAASQELLALTRTLGKITTPEQMTPFIAKFASWASRRDAMLKERTCAHSGQRPTYVRAGQLWRYTHRQLRKPTVSFEVTSWATKLFTWMTTA